MADHVEVLKNVRKFCGKSDIADALDAAIAAIAQQAVAVDHRALWLDLAGVLVDIDRTGFDDVCHQTIKRVHDKLRGRDVASSAPGGGGEELRVIAKRNLRKLIELGSDDKRTMLLCLEELS